MKVPDITQKKSRKFSNESSDSKLLEWLTQRHYIALGAANFSIENQKQKIRLKWTQALKKCFPLKIKWLIFSNCGWYLQMQVKFKTKWIFINHFWNRLPANEIEIKYIIFSFKIALKYMYFLTLMVKIITTEESKIF